MKYFEAVQLGRRRVEDAVSLLQEVAGQCHPLLFLKLGGGPWEPVGEEMLHSIVPGESGTAAIVICDSEGNAKAMSAWVPVREAETKRLALASRGLAEFDGEVNLPV